MFKRSLAIVGAALAIAALSVSARAGDLNNAYALAPLPVKAPAVVLPAPNPCTYTNCSGAFAGLTLTNINVLNVNLFNGGTTNAAGSYMGGEAGYQFLNGNYLLKAFARVEYEIYQPANDALSGSAFKDKLFAFEGAELGGNLANLFPGVAASLQLPTWMTPLVMGVEIGGCQHGSKLSGYCVGGAAHYYIPASRWEFKADVLNAQYGATSVGSGNSSVETRSTAGIVYHF